MANTVFRVGNFLPPPIRELPDPFTRFRWHLRRGGHLLQRLQIAGSPQSGVG